MSVVPNPLILFNNHFYGHRRHYAYPLRLRIAEHLGFDGYEFHSPDPDNDHTRSEIAAALRGSSLGKMGMAISVTGAADDQEHLIDSELERTRDLLAWLAALPRADQEAPYVNLSITSDINPVSREFHESGSAYAEDRHFARAAYLCRTIDDMLKEFGLTGNLYTHTWFITDTPQSQLRILRESQAKILRPGFQTFHVHFHRDVPDLPDMLDLPGMERLGGVSLLNAWPEPTPFRITQITDGQIDMAQLLAHLWKRGYAGPITSHAWDLGGDPFLTAQRFMSYVHEIADRFERFPELNPATPERA